MPREIKNIEYTSHFARSYKKLTKLEKKLAKEREKLFREDCFNPILKTHKLKGKLKEYWSFSLAPNLRIMFKFVKDKEVLFLDVGSHKVYEVVC